MAKREPSAIRIEGDVAYVSLNHDLEAAIDAVDIPLIQGKRWRAHICTHGHVYACRYASNKTELMHRVLMETPDRLMVDHIDGNGLNNRRSNMRNCTMTQNMANKVVERRNKLGIKGVSARDGKYRAVIKPGGKSIYLGNYNTPDEAAAAYKGAARVLWGNFAKE